MNILKVGGSVLKSRKGFTQFLRIASSSRKPALIIISAFATVTRNLKYIAEVAEKGYEKKSIALLQDLFNQHKKTARQIIENQSSIIELFEKIDTYFSDLAKVINGIALTKELSPRVNDIVLSYGELLALRIISAYLSDKNIEHAPVNSDKIIISDSNFGSANPIEKTTLKNVNKILKPALKSKGLVVMQGFVASNSKGDITTMGIESSNLTAALMAKMLNSNKVTYWTDVNGIRNADPGAVENTELIEKMNYDDAEKAGEYGLQLIYPPMIKYVRENNIELVFKSAFDINNEMTTVKTRGKNNSRLIVNDRDYITIFNVNLADFSGVLSKKKSDIYLPSLIKRLEYDEDIIRLKVNQRDIKRTLKYLHKWL